jgi:miniconductance mechanosensitive channel
VPSFGADGDVIDVALHTITVQNWDKTVSIIPTSQLIDKGFKNWRGMQESGGRRIKRSLFVDLQTVKFLNPDEINRLKNMHLLKDYIMARQTEISNWNRAKGIDEDKNLKEGPCNGRRMTNLGCFREYIKRYLGDHPLIKSDGSMTFLVRQLQPTEKGIPLEIYVFCSDTRWVHYEGVQADLFDHLFAIISDFDLRLFQEVSGIDFIKLLR